MNRTHGTVWSVVKLTFTKITGVFAMSRSGYCGLCNKYASIVEEYGGNGKEQQLALKRVLQKNIPTPW